MAIKVNGTTVIDDSRVVQNLGTALSVNNGGSGANTFTANSVLLGNGTNAFQVVSPGTTGNVLTSDGTTWVSSAASSSAAKSISFALVFGL